MFGKKTAAVTSYTPAIKTHMDKSIQIYFRSRPEQCEKNDFKKEKTDFS